MEVENHHPAQQPYTVQTNNSRAKYCSVCLSVFTESLTLSISTLPSAFLWLSFVFLCFPFVILSYWKQLCTKKDVFWLKSKYPRKYVCEIESERKRENIYWLQCVIVQTREQF